ncbi:MAG: tetratricopeptide repeat protein [Myxococcota bacterium]
MPVRALLLTDVVDSTRLTESLGDARMAEVWAAHDQAARTLLVEHRGREIDKSDGFLLLFETVDDAAGFAEAYHTAIGALDPPLTARAGLHVGDVVLRDNPPQDVARGAKPLEVEGLAKPTAARVMSVARGRQTLATSQAVHDLSPAWSSTSHGHWQLGGIREPLELFGIHRPAELPTSPPPDGAKAWRVVRADGGWRPVRATAHQLPRERDPFVGREPDLYALQDLLDRNTPLTTVVGAGGTGKTRLVTRLGWRCLGENPGGVWFCDLSEARDVEGLAHAVAGTLDVVLGSDPIAQLGHAIAGRGRCLVVLDNFEHLVGHAAETVGEWLDRATEARFVVTSREVLGLPGETTVHLSPLPIEEGVALFAARAQQARRDFDPIATRPDVSALVEALDGLPLAIELAAARVRVMSPARMRERLDERFRLLTSPGGRPSRQATLRATLDWSWQLLTADEQRAFGQLALFEGGMSLEAAEAVLQLEAAWPVDVVQALVDKSLLQEVGEGRFEMLGSVHAYARERLATSPDRAALEARHGAFFATHGTDEAMAALDGEGGPARCRALARDLQNLVTASRRNARAGDGEAAVSCLVAAWAVLSLQGSARSALELGETLEPLSLAPAVRIRLARALGHVRQRVGQLDTARESYALALRGSRERGDRLGEGRVLCNLGNLDLQQGHTASARARYDEALAIHHAEGHRAAEGVALLNRGLLHAQTERTEAARADYESALVRLRELGNQRAEAMTLINLGNLYCDVGQNDEAHACYTTALALARDLGNRRGEAMTRANLAALDIDAGRVDDALAHYTAALAEFRREGDRRFEAIVLGNIGVLHADRGEREEAREAYGTALDIAEQVGDIAQVATLRERLDTIT